MRELIEATPDVDLLVAMEPEELAFRLLSTLERELRRERYIHLGNYLGQLTPGDRQSPNPLSYDKVEQLKLAVTEAWSWLEAQGLVIRAPDNNGMNGFSILSRRAEKLKDETAFAKYKVTRLLPKESLHARMADRVWSAFVRSEYDNAVFQAMKAVEVYVREAGSYGNELIGTKLMQEAFKPDGGRLTDNTAEAGERVGRMQLFCGAIGSYKNPNSHRDVDLDDPVEALELILLANHLMRIVDARAAELRA